jgi:hypothetical protein
MIGRAEATRNALAKGASAEEIERQAVNYERQVGTVPFNNMIRALNMHPWNNDAADGRARRCVDRTWKKAWKKSLT